MPKMSKEELIAKEHEVFDRATNEICNYFLKNFRFDGNEVSIQRIPCCLLNLETEFVTAYLKSPIRNVRENTKYATLKNEFKDLLAQIDRRKYELSFLKCDT